MRQATIFVVSTLMLALPARGGDAELCVGIGDPFPDLRFEKLLTPEDYDTLALEAREGEVLLSDISGELLVIEFFNKYCLTCWRQAPQLQTFSDLLEPGDLAGRVQILSVAAGNNEKELQQFRDEFEIRYPLAADPAFEQFYTLGDPGGTPCTAFLLRRDGHWILADFHVGFYGDVELLARSRALLKGWSGGSGDAGRAQSVPVPAEISPSEIQTFLSAVTGRGVSVEPLDMDDGRVLYAAVDEQGLPTGVYAAAARREPICDLCHPIHFLFAFDVDGQVRGYEPIYVTKFGNEPWSREDTKRFRETLVGRELVELPFDPEADAVTSATMSSALIFDEVRRAARYLPAINTR